MLARAAHVYSLTYRKYAELTLSVSDAAFCQIVRSDFYANFVASKNADVVLTHLARDMRGH